MTRFGLTRLRRQFAARPAAAVAFTVVFGWSLLTSSLLHTHLRFDEVVAVSAPVTSIHGPAVSGGPGRRAASACLACELGCISLFGLHLHLVTRPRDSVGLVRPLPPAPPRARLSAGDVQLRAPPRQHS
ncbi:MAG: hypothetical protein HYU66_03970 [Armatimonadetes bacterium]|nr:hypothetical protein [Armatimonadota bacterium]